MAYIGTQPKDVRSFGRAKFDFTATQGQTAFTGADDDSKTLGFTNGQIEVYVNGILMDESDFTTSNGNTVTLASAANLNDVISIVAMQTDIPNSDYVPASGGTFTGNVTHSGTVTNSGNVTVGGTLGVTGATTTAALTASGDVGVATRLQVGDSSITQAYTQANFGYVADFQAATGSQTFISIAEPSVSSLGNNGTVIGEDASDTYITQRGNKNIKLGTANVNRLIVDGSGRVTMPNQPMFDAYLTANTSHSAGNYNMSTGDGWSTRTNVGSHFSSGTFTAPVAGKYLFCAGISAGHPVGAMTYFSCEFQVNGGRRYIHWFGKGGGSNSYAAANNTAIISLAASDYVRLHTEKSHGVTVLGGAAYTHFGGMLIG